MRGILLISHGQLADGMYSAVKMIAGEAANVYTTSLVPSDGPEQFKEKLHKIQGELDKYDEVFVFADLFGGSPCNTTFSEYVNRHNYHFITGMNFPMILTAILQPEESVESLMNAGKEGIVDVRQMMAAMQSGDDDE